jgi:hypothetical protein
MFANVRECSWVFVDVCRWLQVFVKVIGGCRPRQVVL